MHSYIYLLCIIFSQDIDIEERYHVLREQLNQFKMEGQVMVCGDFNARCDGLSDVDGEPSRCCVDLVKNGQGELLVDCMRSSGLVFVSGRQGRDQFTCISSRDRSVVDYCLVSEEELMSIRNFDVKTMSQCEEELCGGEEGYRIPDHSILLRSGHTGRWGEPGVPHIPTKKCEEHPCVKFVVPEDYMSGQENFISSMMAHLKRLNDDQGELDALYSDLLTGL